MCKSPRLALCEAGIEATGRDWPQSHIVSKDKVIIWWLILFKIFFNFLFYKWLILEKNL